MIPPEALLSGLLEIWPYLLGAAGVALAIGFAAPVRKRPKEEIRTIVKEEIQNDVKIVTKINKREVAIDYDVFLKMLSDYEKARQEAQKSILTQLALLEAKKEEERDKLLRDLTNPDLAYRDLVKVKRINGASKKRKAEEEGEEDVEVDTSELYQA